MTQAELINRVNQMLSPIYGSNEKRVKDTLDALGEVSKFELLKEKGEVPFPGLGKLVVVATAARPGRNPATGAAIQIPAGRRASFKVGKELKDALKG